MAFDPPTSIAASACPNCRGETHRYRERAGDAWIDRLVCSAGCGWSQDETPPVSREAVLEALLRKARESLIEAQLEPSDEALLREIDAALAPEPAAPRVEPRGFRPPWLMGGLVTIPTPPPPTTEPHAHVADPSGACVYCGERRCCHDLAATTAAKAALEAQLAEAQEQAALDRAAMDAYDRSWALRNREQTKLETERDALAAKLKAARELLAEVIEGVDAGRISITVGQENRIRAALAASGPGETQG